MTAARRHYGRNTNKGQHAPQATLTSTAQYTHKTGRLFRPTNTSAQAADLDRLWDYGLAADMLLVDAKPPRDAALPGGNGLAFDWRLLVGRQMLKPWLLAGGLTPENVNAAIRLTRAQGVDVSSGVVSAPGVKDAERIRQFVARATAPVL